MKGCNSICASICIPQKHTLVILSQCEGVAEETFLSSVTKTRSRLERALSRYFYSDVVVLRPLFGTRGVTRPRPQLRSFDHHADLWEQRPLPFADPAAASLCVAL